LESADPDTVTFEEKKLHRANLRDTDLGNAHLSWAILPGGDLRDAFLPGAKFEGAVLDNIDAAGPQRVEESHGVADPGKGEHAPAA